MSKAKEIILLLIPIIVVLIILIFWQSEIILTILVILALIATFKIKYYKKEWQLFLVGCIIGLIFELVGNFVLGQSWPEASFFTIPIWLPLGWGYGFILMRRIGNIIVKIERRYFFIMYIIV